MRRAFTGWPEQAYDVLLKLDGDPPASVRQGLRKDRERLVRQPMIDLLQDVADADAAYGDFSVWGLGSMVWPWQRQCGVVRIGPKAEFSLWFDLDGLAVLGCWWYPGAENVATYRAAVASDASGPELVSIVEALQHNGSEIAGDQLKRTPRGYPADHPRADLLRHRTLIVTRPLGCDDWLHTPEAVDRVLEAYALLRPLASWHVEHIESR
ncbi:DUF2461 family protein [Actinopolymorpha alba]|uniref:DUF2461 family protein n=1 Tax=Actinopolymorpha alba TaxID=533267 RepID=UPI000684C7DA|nr:DUF2461 family protein [Actinopolymorpha alba]